MYSYKQRKKAVELYIKYGKNAAAVIRKLGYPDRHSLKDYLNLEDTEQMFFALYPLMIKGEFTMKDATELLGNNLSVWDLMEICWKYNLSTSCQKETTIEEELENSKKCEVEYNE